jgi:hypothetical protein
VPDALIQAHATIRVTLDPVLMRAWHAGRGQLEGLKTDRAGGFVVTGPKAELIGLLLAPRALGHVRVQITAAKPADGDITITQVSAKGVDGGVTLRLAAQKRR